MLRMKIILNITCECVCESCLDCQVHQLGGAVLAEHLNKVGGVTEGDQGQE